MLSHLSHVHVYDRLLERPLLPLVTTCIFTLYLLLYRYLHTPMCLADPNCGLCVAVTSTTPLRQLQTRQRQGFKRCTKKLGPDNTSNSLFLMIPVPNSGLWLPPHTCTGKIPYKAESMMAVSKICIIRAVSHQ